MKLPKPNISISPEAELLIRELLNRIYEDIQVFVSGMFYQGISNYLKESLDAHGSGFNKLRLVLSKDISLLKLISN